MRIMDNYEAFLLLRRNRHWILSRTGKEDRHETKIDMLGVYADVRDRIGDGNILTVFDEPAVCPPIILMDRPGLQDEFSGDSPQLNWREIRQA